jgi:hypothetical protein
MMGEELNELFNNFYNTYQGYAFNIELLNEETMDNTNTIIGKHENEPFSRWNYNLKTKL